MPNPTIMTRAFTPVFNAPSASASGASLASSSSSNPSSDPGAAFGLPPAGTLQDAFVVPSSASAANAAGGFDPAANVLPTLAGLDPLTYRTADPTQLPAAQPSERDFVEQARAHASPAEFAAAKRLSNTGMDSMWTNYVAQYAAVAGPVKADQLDHVMRTAMNADQTAYSLGKQEHPEPRPFEVGTTNTGDSYPSGHTATAYAAATVLATYWPERAQEFYAAAANVGRSRVLLDMHFAGDVAAGAKLGVDVARQVIASQQAA